jgi:hypothetical protein
MTKSHSSRQSLAGGTWEAVVLLVWVLLSAWFPSDGGAPWGFFVIRVAPLGPRILGLLVLSSPWPVLVRRIWVLLLWRLVQWIFAVAPTFSAVVSSEAVLGDFSSALWWAPAIQGFGELQRRRAIANSNSSSSSRFRGPRCIFLLFLVLSVRSKIWCIFLYPQKKNPIRVGNLQTWSANRWSFSEHDTPTRSMETGIRLIFILAREES